MAEIRDRVKELRKIRAGDLVPNERNWRMHSQGQRDALAGVLEEIGYADALLARELPDGSVELLDGHCRRELTPDTIVPVLIVDLDDAEAAKLLVTLDPLAAMADADAEKLESLLRDVDSGNETVQQMLADLAAENGIAVVDEEANIDRDYSSEDERWGVYVKCESEEQQCTLMSQLSDDGYECRKSYR